MKIYILKAWTAASAWLTAAPIPVTATPPSQSRKEPFFDWEYLVTHGHVIFARMNHLNFIGKRLLTVLTLSIIAFWASLTFAVDLISDPIGNNTDRPSTHATFQINTGQVAAMSMNFDIRPFLNDLFSVSDIKKEFIDKTLIELSTENRMKTPCFQADGMYYQWIKEKVVYYPHCNPKSASTDAPRRLWVYALLTDASGQVKPWIGIFILQSKWFGFASTWKYLAVTDDHGVLMRHPTEDQVEEININLIKHTLKMDFSDLPILPY